MAGRLAPFWLDGEVCDVELGQDIAARHVDDEILTSLISGDAVQIDHHRCSRQYLSGSLSPLLLSPVDPAGSTAVDLCGDRSASTVPRHDYRRLWRETVGL